MGGGQWFLPPATRVVRVSRELYIYSYRVEFHFKGHKKIKSMARLKYFCIDLLKYVDIKRVWTSTQNNGCHCYFLVVKKDLYINFVFEWKKTWWYTSVRFSYFLTMFF